MVINLDIVTDLGGLQAVLTQAYKAMIVHCGDLITIAQAIAGFATLWYIAVRIWEKIARAEPVEVYPLLRPFGIGIAILFFPGVIAFVNGVMEPTVEGTRVIADDANKAVGVLLQQRQEALQKSEDWQLYVGSTGSGDLDKWEALSGEADSGALSGLSNRVKFEMARTAYNNRSSIREWLSEILQMLFESAALCIDTVRIFYMIVLGVLGPLAFAFCIFDGFGHIIRDWFARYLNVFLWLPVANIFGALISYIQQEMIRLDIAQVNATGHTGFGPADTAYIVFLILSITGYFTVPYLTNYIISGGGIGVRRAIRFIGIQH
jgi:conjugative transposon TraJ protein